MDYKRIYDELCNRGKTIRTVGYVEIHHIIPRCLGGSDQDENLTKLTPEEHYVAHQLLVKIYPDDRKIAYAAHMMTVAASTSARKNKSYGWIRRAISKANSGPGNPMYGRSLSEDERKQRGRTGIENGFYGKHHSTESKAKMSATKKQAYVYREPWNKDKKSSEEHRKNISDGLLKHHQERNKPHPNFGRITSDATKEKIRIALKGKKLSQEHIEKMSIPKGPQARTTCPYCNKEGGLSNMMRYHFDNCKFRK